jgi:hypothetical protein
LILQEKLGEKEEVQRILTAQKAETEAAHSRCQNKLRELAEHEQVRMSGSVVSRQLSQTSHTHVVLDCPFSIQVTMSSTLLLCVRASETSRGLMLS